MKLNEYLALKFMSYGFPCEHIRHVLENFKLPDGVPWNVEVEVGEPEVALLARQAVDAIIRKQATKDD